MPKSNGQITARDLRQGLLKANHFPSDPLIETGFIQDLAVTFPDHLDDPIYVAIAESERTHNVSLTTSYSLYAQTSFDIPAWVDQIFVLATAAIQMTQGTGSDQGVLVALAFSGGEVEQSQQQDIKTGDTGSVHVVTSVAASGVAGSTYTVDQYARTSIGTNAANNGEVNALVIGTR